MSQAEGKSVSQKESQEREELQLVGLAYEESLMFGGGLHFSPILKI